jgi:hypothetical protein
VQGTSLTALLQAPHAKKYLHTVHVAILTVHAENEVNMTSTVAVNMPTHTNIKVYLNSNTGTFNLENASGLVQITNVLGAVVWQSEINTPLQNVDVKHLPKGVYVLHHKQDKMKLVIE